jgi:hypothetical protein
MSESNDDKTVKCDGCRAIVTVKYEQNDRNGFIRMYCDHVLERNSMHPLCKKCIDKISETDSIVNMIDGFVRIEDNDWKLKILISDKITAFLCQLSHNIDESLSELDKRITWLERRYRSE